MRGSISKRYKGSWTIRLDLGYKIDPSTGRRIRNQKCFSVKGTRKEAEAKLAELLHDANRNQLVEPTRTTFGQWLDEWLDTMIKPPNRRIRTYETYRSVVERHIKPALGGIRLQQLRAIDIKGYYNRSSLSPSTLQQHHAIIHSALKAALLMELVPRNVAELVVGKPRAAKGESALNNCWDVQEARRFLSAAKEAGIQAAAFYSLALDSGARKAELCGLKWSDIDFNTGKISIVRQLVRPGNKPVFGPPKNSLPRTIDISPATLALLRRHRANQAQLKLAYRSHYHDHGLVFAKEWEHLLPHRDTLGDPLQMNNIGQREFKRLIKAAGVKPITFHGLRHTCATLLLKAGVPIKVVQERLGHKRIEITLNTYAHVLPSMQQDAASKMSSLLHT